MNGKFEKSAQIYFYNYFSLKHLIIPSLLPSLHGLFAQGQAMNQIQI